jgi:hypothetical protein
MVGHLPIPRKHRQPAVLLRSPRAPVVAQCGAESLKLRNGWRVKEVLEPVVTSASGTGAGCDYAASPNAGTTSPYVNVHLWAEGPFGTGVNNEIVLVVSTLIEGPAGTNPYQ